MSSVAALITYQLDRRSSLKSRGRHFLRDESPSQPDVVSGIS